MIRFIITIFFLFSPLMLFAYEPTTTHAGLTEQIVEFYNHTATSTVADGDKEKIISGAIAEDDNYRYINHLYDPTRGAGYNNYRSAKSWALDTTGLNGYAWQDGIQAYTEGRHDDAMVALGHILHLVEDMAVPEHTRNDGHGKEFLIHKSPYEDWANENKNRTTLTELSNTLISEGIRAKHLPTFVELFDFMARYSNGNFFSVDTIDDKIMPYANPVKTRKDENYVYGVDVLSAKEVKLLVKSTDKSGKEVISVFTKDDKSVLSSYFDRLSRQVVPVGASVVELFIQEGEKARAEFLAKEQWKRELAEGGAKWRSFVLASAPWGTKWAAGSLFAVSDVLEGVITFGWNTGSTVVGWVKGGTESTVQIAMDVTKGGVTSAGIIAASGGLWVYDKGTEVVVPVFTQAKVFIQESTAKKSAGVGDGAGGEAVGFAVATTTPAFYTVSLETGTSFSPFESVLPRLVFVGVSTTTAGTVVARDILADVGTIITLGYDDAPGPAVYVPDVGDSSTALEIHETHSLEPPATPTLAKPILSVPQCAFSLATDGCLLSTKKFHAEWAPVVGADYYTISKNGVFATTTEASLDLEAQDFSDHVLEVAAATVSTTSATSTKTVSVASIPIAINEVAWMGTQTSTNDEWFELKNNTARNIDLANWALEAKDGKPYVKLAGVIAPHAYLVFERTNDSTILNVAAHQVYTGALGNEGEELALSYASSTLDRTPPVSGGKWAGGENSTTTKKTMERYASKESGANPENWGTNLGFIKNGVDEGGKEIQGTPGERNSVSYLINKGQDITEDVTLQRDEGPYVVTGWQNVGASNTLTLEPGVHIQFREGESRDGVLRVRGALHADGTTENPVIFEPFTEGSGQGRVDIVDSTATSTFENVAFLGTDGGVDLYRSSAVFNNVRFASTTNGAIGLYDHSTAIIASSTIEHVLDGDAIGIYTGSVLTVASSTIRGVVDGNGVGVYRSAAHIASTTIENIQDGDGIGAYDSVLVVASSTIRDIGEGSALALFDATSTLSAVVLEGGKENGIMVGGGQTSIQDTSISGFQEAGVLIYDAPVSISDSKITENGVGIDATDGVVPMLDNVSVAGNTENILEAGVIDVE